MKKDIIKRIQKLLQLADTSKNSNVEEAAAAATKAQALMEKHRIKKAMLDASDKEVLTSKTLVDNGRPENWKVYLCNSISRHNGCYIIKSADYEKDNIVCIAGEVKDIETVQELYAYIVKELIRLCLGDLIKTQKLHGFCPDKTYTKSFYLGAIATIDQRLRQANQEMRNSELKKTADPQEKDKLKNVLARLDNRCQKAKEWVDKNMNAKFENVSINTHDADGYNAGKNAAKSLSLNPNRPKLTGD